MGSVIGRFIALLPVAIRETWREATGRMCSRSCSEMHSFDTYCILGPHGKG